MTPNAARDDDEGVGEAGDGWGRPPREGRGRRRALDRRLIGTHPMCGPQARLSVARMLSLLSVAEGRGSKTRADDKIFKGEAEDDRQRWKQPASGTTKEKPCDSAKD